MRSAILQVVYDLIPAFGTDGHLYKPSTSVDHIVPVRFKPGDRVLVHVSRNRGESYRGVVELAWVENYRRRYLIELESRPLSQH